MGLLWAAIIVLALLIWCMAALLAQTRDQVAALIADRDTLRLRQAVLEMQHAEVAAAAKSAQDVAAATARYAFAPQGQKPS